MKKLVIAVATALGSLSVVAFLLVLHPRVEPPQGRVLASSRAAAPPSVALASGERTPAGEPPAVEAPAEAPTDARALRELVARLRGLSREELLRVSNAEFGFEQSALVEQLRSLRGEWVVPELGRLAVGETDPLVKAVLVAGLCKAALHERLDDPRMLDCVRELLPQLAAAESDPFRAARFVVVGAYGACLRQQVDLAALLLPHLDGSDNPDVLVRGYLFLGQSPGAEGALLGALASRPEADGRFGALEGLRAAALAGRLPSGEVARAGIAALGNETSARNRTLLVEMIGSAGGEEGLAALESIVDRGDPDLVGAAASMIAAKRDPERAEEVLERALAAGSLGAVERAAIYRALGAVPGERSGERLLAAVRNGELGAEERLGALRGLWSRPADEGIRGELASLVAGDEPGPIRAESLRMLSLRAGGDGSGGPALDVRRMAEEDRDPEVRREAVVLSTLKGGEDPRGWLEERLLRDRSPDVQAAALGALVVQARFTGDSERVRSHLEGVKRSTGDPEVLALVARGEKMVSEYDPRRVELELKQDAEFYRQVAPYTTGAARQSMERQAEYYRRMVEAMTALAGTR